MSIRKLLVGFIQAAIGVALGEFVPPAFSAAAERPNVVFIMADDFGYECVNANGGGFAATGKTYPTPNLDALAKSGMRFTHCYSQPLCTPTRVELMTGLYNQRNYVRFGLLAPGATTWMQVLRDAGYATAIAGKWQLMGGLEGPGHFGFDRYCLWQLDRIPRRYANAGLEIDGKRVDLDGKYGPDVCCDYLCDFIRREKNGPFLAYYPMILTHDPFEPTPDSAHWDPGEKRRERAVSQTKNFPDMVAYADKLVGKIVRTLDEEGIRDRTLVVFTGDNGTHPTIASTLDGKPYQGGKGQTTNAGTHVPLIISLPGVVPPGKVSDRLVDFTDFFPTALDFAGIARPESVPLGIEPAANADSGNATPRTVPLDGMSLSPTLRGEPDAVGREWVYLWYSRQGGPTGAEFARDRRWKLYRTEQLFDLDADPLETNPLSVSAAELSAEDRRQVEALGAVLERMKDSRNPDAPPAAPAIKPE